MDAITKINVTDDVALITLRNSPANMEFMARVFKDIAETRKYFGRENL